MDFVVANENDFINIRNFYHKIIEHMDTSPFSSGWKKGIYPSDKDLKSLIKNKELFYTFDEEGITSCFALNCLYNSGYKEAKWQVEANENEVYYLHMLAIRVDKRGTGLSKAIIKFVLHKAKMDNKKAVRLDVYYKNIVAKKLYESFHFIYIGKLNIFYDDTGYDDYYLYEKPV